MNTKNLKIYGERNTGTNYLTRLIELNTAIVPLRGTVPRPVKWASRLFQSSEYVKDAYFKSNFQHTLGWKHMLVPPPEELRQYDICREGLAFLTLTKNPYSWLLSLYRRPYHMKSSREGSLESFLQRKWPTVGRECANDAFANPVELWNTKNRAYLRLAQEFTVVNVKYEDLVADPATVVDAVCDELSLPGSTQNFTNINRSTKGDAKSFEQFQRYYLEERWRDKLSSEAVELINERLDKSLVRKFGYQIVDEQNS